MSRLGPVVIACIALPLLWGAARAEAQADAQVADLNSQGIEAYQALDMDAARAKLEEALGVAQQNGLGGPVVAQVYMNLGVVQIAGFNDRDQGLAAFVSALCMQPDVQLDPLLSTPDVQQAFGQAQQDAAAGACGPGPAAPPAGPPQLMPTQPPPSYGGPQVADLECPPGVVCGDEGGDDSGPKDFARFFFNLQLVGAFTYVSSGLEADSPAPIANVLTGSFVDVNGDGIVELENGIDASTGMPIEDDVIAGDGLTDADPDGDGVPNTFDFDGNGTQDNRYYFNPASAWVPDKDSFDDYEDQAGGVPRARTPLPGTCEADGIATGPLDVESTDGSGGNFLDYVPSKYCVRVEQPGVVNNLALRLNPGYFITDGFALSLPIRIQFNSGEGSMSNMLIGLRGEVLFSEMEEPTGFPISFFFGATYGQIQAQPPPKDASIAAPFVTSGPIGAHIGMNVRWRIHRNFGLIVAPEFDVQFPGLLFNFDLAGGLEAAF